MASHSRSPVRSTPEWSVLFHPSSHPLVDGKVQVHINGPTIHDPAHMPHGGVKKSGWGRFNGIECVPSPPLLLSPS